MKKGCIFALAKEGFQNVKITPQRPLLQQLRKGARVVEEARLESE